MLGGAAHVVGNVITCRISPSEPKFYHPSLTGKNMPIYLDIIAPYYIKRKAEKDCHISSILLCLVLILERHLLGLTLDVRLICFSLI